MTKKNVLLVGESWVSSANHYKGWDTFSSVTFHLGAEPLVNALKDSDFALTYMASGIRLRARAMASGSSIASIRPSPMPRRATTVPQGSTMSEWP